MHERRFNDAIERLRRPERIALLEVERVLDLILKDIDVRSVLDAGTGSGIFAEAFVQRGLIVKGIDPNPEMLKAASEFVPLATFQEGTIEAIPFDDKSFDLVFLGHVLHEADDMLKALTETKRCAIQRVAALEWPHAIEEIGPPINHRLNPDDVEVMAKKAGFAHVDIHKLDHMILYIFS